MKRIHLLLLALLALFAGAPFRAAAEETFRDRVVVIPVGCLLYTSDAADD